MGILFVGLLAAALVYFLAADDDGSTEAAIAGTKMYQHNLALMGGKAALAADSFNRWFDGLWHGRPLAWTIVVLAAAIALACFWVAHMLSVSPSDQPGATLGAKPIPGDRFDRDEQERKAR